jgi:ribosomal protein S18 acetylase RimI-like enzyme
VTNNSWPSGFTVRPPHADEARAVADLCRARGLADFGEADWSLEDTLADWGRLGFDLDRDARVVVAPDGGLAAYAEAHKRPNFVQVGENVGLHPAFRGQGLEIPFLELVESLAAQHGLLPLRWMSEVGRGRALAERGYVPRRFLWQMRIDLAEEPAPPSWPEGYSVRLMAEADEPATHALIDKAFTRPDRAPVPYEEWRRYMVERDDFDRSLQFVAVKGDEIAGAALCMTYHDPDEGWVRTLAVEERHRGLGLGQALLRHAFREFRRRGITMAGLGVDANNPSATKLYRGVGMRAVHEYHEYEKPVVNPDAGAV